MAAVPGFVGPANTTLALNGDAEDTINLYLEATAPGVSKTGWQFLPTPGFRPFANLTSGPTWQVFQENGRAFACGGDAFYEIFEDGTSTLYGGLAASIDGHPPTICSNGTAGNQLFITAGGSGYIFNIVTNTLTLITDPGFPTGSAYMGEFMDGYFLVLITDSRAFQISALEDGLSWDALDIAERSEASDSIVCMIRSHREIWLLGLQTTEVWVDNGDPDFPFAPLQGVFVEQGCIGAFTACRIDNTIMWAGRNTDGSGVVWRAKGYTPERVSTHAMEWDIQQFSMAETRAWPYQIDGHLFYVFVQPANRWSWCYDVASGAWHKRAGWDSLACEWIPYRPIAHMFAFDKHLVGDRASATIYQMSQDFFDSQFTQA